MLSFGFAVKMPAMFFWPSKIKARAQNGKRKLNGGGGDRSERTPKTLGGALPLIFCIHVRSGPIYCGGYLPCKKDYKVMVFYM